jgi:hypothetical protein
MKGVFGSDGNNIEFDGQISGNTLWITGTYTGKA